MMSLILNQKVLLLLLLAAAATYRFIIQDIDGDANAATSDGIFVKLIDGISMPAIGDILYVTGTVSEFFNLTRIDSVTQVHELTLITVTLILFLRMQYKHWYVHSLAVIEHYLRYFDLPRCMQHIRNLHCSAHTLSCMLRVADHNCLQRL
jgi:hypothetical protein